MKNRNRDALGSSTQKKPSHLVRLWAVMRPFSLHIAVAAGVMVIAGTAIAGWMTYREWTHAQAMNLLTGAKGEKDYLKVIEKYPASGACVLARIHLIDLYWKQGRFRQAGEILELLAGETPGTPLETFARYGLGEAYLSEGLHSESVRLFKSLADKQDATSFFRMLARFGLGRSYILRGDVKEGIEVLEAEHKASENAVWADYIQALIAAARHNKTVVSRES